ncbi:MAG: 50S ribosomal protein L21 [Candidatus Hydrogenedentes bacterium]|nr:50S ribosomal protein L21 [Candidatus Hydrogenedentota bacterium]
MYAVVVTGGKQYKVTEGDRLRVEKLNTPVGEKVELDKVCLLVKEDGIVAEPDALSGVSVIAEVTSEGRRKKIKVFKKKRRKNYMRTYGHRQQFSEITIREIKA